LVVQPKKALKEKSFGAFYLELL